MKEIKIGKYSKEWFRKRMVIRNRIYAAITFVGLFVLCSFVGDCGTILDYIAFYGLITGLSALFSFIVYSIFELEFEHFEEIYKNFLFDTVRCERKKQDKKMKKWLI